MSVYRGHLRKMLITVRGELQGEQVGEGSPVNRWEWVRNVWPVRLRMRAVSIHRLYGRGWVVNGTGLNERRRF